MTVLVGGMFLPAGHLGGRRQHCSDCLQSCESGGLALAVCVRDREVWGQEVACLVREGGGHFPKSNVGGGSWLLSAGQPWLTKEGP